MALREHQVEWEEDDGIAIGAFEGYEVAGIELFQGEWTVSYGPGMGVTKAFSSEAEARRWVAIHAPDLADPDVAGRL